MIMMEKETLKHFGMMLVSGCFSMFIVYIIISGMVSIFIGITIGGLVIAYVSLILSRRVPELP